MVVRRGSTVVCDSPDSLLDETRHLERVFRKNNYNSDFIKLNTHCNTEPNETTNNPTPVTTATIPYIKGTSETIAWILRPYNIRVAHKSITTLRHMLTNVKDKDLLTTDRERCTESSVLTINLLIILGRNLKTRLTEHKRATKNSDIRNHISEHHQLTKHKIDWDSTECVTYTTNYQQRLTLESWARLFES